MTTRMQTLDGLFAHDRAYRISFAHLPGCVISIRAWEEAWSDALAAGATQKARFCGTMVLTRFEDSGRPTGEWLVLRGQRRLLTYLLLFAALRDFAVEAEPRMRDGIDRQFREGRGHPLCLKSSEREGDYVDEVMQEINGERRRGDPAEGYDYFTGLLARQPSIASQLHEGLGLLRYLEITLEAEDDANQVLARLNVHHD